MLQRSNADLDGRAKAPFLLLISHLYSFIFSIILSSAQSFFLGQKVFLILLLLQLSFANEPQG